jgi:hypothetical protein
MAGRRGASERLSHLQVAILTVVAQGELVGKGGAYGAGEIRGILRGFRTTSYVSMSYPRSLRNLKAKGLIDEIPYFFRGEPSGYLLGLSEKGRVLVRTRKLGLTGVADSHPVRIEATWDGYVSTYAS